MAISDNGGIEFREGEVLWLARRRLVAEFADSQNIAQGYMPDSKNEDDPCDAEEAKVRRHMQQHAHELP